MRRLTVLPCPESWEAMREDGDGRFCERCRLRVTEVAKLDAEGVDAMLAYAERGRVCASFELEDGRARTGLGAAAGLMVLTLAGCATSTQPQPQPPSAAPEVQVTITMEEAKALPVERTSGIRGRVTGAVVYDSSWTEEVTAGFVSAPLFD